MSTRPKPCSNGFHSENGWLYCDEIRLQDLHQQLMTSGVFPASPAFVYSRRRLEENARQYQTALAKLPVKGELYYSIKANHNMQILRLLRSWGCGLTLVSGGELQIALAAGFEPSRLLLNGSGKVGWEVEAAVRADVMLNVDSEFDLQQTVAVCKRLGRPASALLRLNLDIDPRVHKYVSTGMSGSKFGLDPAALKRVAMVLTSGDCPVKLRGLHCHLGSTVKDAAVLRESLRRLLVVRQELTSQGLKGVNVLNIGGGLAIDYTRLMDETKPYRVEEDDVKHDLTRLSEDLQSAAAEEPEERRLVCQNAFALVQDYCKERMSRAELDKYMRDFLRQLWPDRNLPESYPALFAEKPVMPTPTSLIESIAGLFTSPRDDDVTLIMEPGRSIVGDTGVLLTTVLGSKTAGKGRFLVVDGAMTDVIRPSLYDAYHHIHPIAPLPSSSPPATTIQQNSEEREISSNSRNASNDPSTKPDLDIERRSRGQDRDLHVVDVVGPVCESGDFLGKDRLLPELPTGACVVVRDVGAYCASMSSNYNARLRAVEVLVDGSSWRIIRRPDTFEDLMRPYQVDSSNQAD